MLHPILCLSLLGFACLAGYMLYCVGRAVGARHASNPPPHVDEKSRETVALGRACRRLWPFDPSYTNFNNGSYGSCPHQVLSACRRMQAQQESNFDWFKFRELHRVREATIAELCPLLGPDVRPNEVTLLHNATTGLYTVLRDVDWQPGDCVLALSTIYKSTEAMLRYMDDTRRDAPSRAIVEVEYPIDDDELVGRVLQEVKREVVGRRIRLAIFDTISSKPGVKVPWERLVACLKPYGILTLIDGAHSIGQEPLDVKRADPDFFVTNPYKWLFAHRSCSVLYVPERNQGTLLKATTPVSETYRRSANMFKEGWEWSGTHDPTSLLSVSAALRFRREVLGGEERIREYNHALAVQGGRLVASRLGTRCLGPEAPLAMVNVELPITVEEAGEDGGKQFFIDGLQRGYGMGALTLVHGGLVWVRLCAQVWLELEDFARVAEALGELCGQLRRRRELGGRSGAGLL
ncbi:hypothetical protein ACQY0O_002369 [Thecaphora frezii]